MNSGLFWTIVGSVAGVMTVLAAVIFGVLQLRHGKDSESGTSLKVRAGRDAYTAARDQVIVKDQRPDQ